MKNELCSIPDCGKRAHCRGWCPTHYGRWHRHGSPNLVMIGHRPKGSISQRNHAGEKYCTKCEQWQPIELFSKSKANTDGLYYYCSDCVRNNARKSKYGIDASRYLAEGDYECPICYRPIDERTAEVDHDHSCCPGQKSCGDCVRGLLCMHCNRGLGFFQDDTERLFNAVKYLEQSDKSCRI